MTEPDWRSMATAPRDGREIRAKELSAPYREMICYFHQISPRYVETWPSREGGILLPFRPDVWQPL